MQFCFHFQDGSAVKLAIAYLFPTEWSQWGIYFYIKNCHLNVKIMLLVTLMSCVTYDSKSDRWN